MPKEASGDYNLPAITCTTQNNGIACYVPREKATIFKNCISVAANGDAPAFYQQHDFTILQDAYVLKFKGEELSDLHYLYFVSLLQKILTKFDWNNKSGWEKVKQEKIEIPINKDSTIAFEFMENYIKELEAERIKELEAYLQVTGLKDYKLNAQEREALAIFASSLRESTQKHPHCHTERSEVSQKNSDRDISAFAKPQYDNYSLHWREFKIGELFNNIRQGARLKQADHIKGNLPFVMAGTENTGISGFIGNENARKFKANALTIDIFGNVFYRAYEFGASDDVGVFWNENNSVKEKSMLFLSAVISKSLQGKFDFGHKLRASQSYDIKILLPILPSLRTSEADEAIHNKGADCHEFADANVGLTSKSRNDEFLANQNGQIAFEFMETFISAVQKEVIKSVVLWSEKRLNATKAIVENHH